MATPCKRLALFVFYHPDGKVNGYVRYLLTELQKEIEDIAIICNGKVSEEGHAYFKTLTSSVFIRENEGFDAAAWKAALTDLVGWDTVCQYDEVVFLNDTCYGPVYPFSEVFTEMQQRETLDFWGITCHYQTMDTTNCHENGIMPEHIQSYFFAVRKRMLCSPAFREFWIQLPKPQTFMEAVGLFETNFTQYFEQRGFSWDTYADLSRYKSIRPYNFSLLHEMPFTLLKDCRIPLVKRKSLVQELPNSHSGPEKEAARALRYIRQETGYDTALIWEDLLQRCNLADLHSRLHLNYVLPVDYVPHEPESSHRTALLLHIYYMDQLAYCLWFAQNMPEDADIYVTTPYGNEDAVRAAFSNTTCGRLEVRGCENRGRDMAGMYVACADVLEKGNYDYICVAHDKKSPQVHQLVGMNFRDMAFENLLASKEYVKNVIATFEREPFLGCLGFPPMFGGEYWYILRDLWAHSRNYPHTVKLLKRCSITVPLSKEKPPVTYGNCFWFRPQALRPLYALHLRYKDFDKEPLSTDGAFSHALERAVCYVAQSQGYYSGVLYTGEYASIMLSAFLYRYQHMEKHMLSAVKCAVKYYIKPHTKLYGIIAWVWHKLYRK